MWIVLEIIILDRSIEPIKYKGMKKRNKCVLNDHDDQQQSIYKNVQSSIRTEHENLSD